MFGARPLGSSGPFTFNPNGQPLQIEINNEVITVSNPNQVLPGGDNPNITAWTSGPLEYAFIYSNACPTATGCTDQALFIVDAEDCCNGSVGVFENDCELTSGINNITTPIYQWQFLQGGVWVNISGATSSSYTGSDGTTYRLCVTDNADGCIYYSDPITASCPAPECSISCSLSWNSALSQLEVNYNASGGTGTFEIQFNEMSTCDPVPQGVGIPQCVQAVSPGIGTAVCPQAPSTQDRCFRVAIYDANDPGLCVCVDYVDVPAEATSCNVTISQQAASCSQSVDLQDLSGVSDQATLELVTNSIDQNVLWQCEATICGDVQTPVPQADTWKLRFGFAIEGGSGGQNFAQIGDFIDFMQVRDNLGPTATLDLDPNTTPYLSGPYGSVDANNLIISASLSSSVYASALKTLIQNAIFAEFGADDSSDYVLRVTASLNNNNWADIEFEVKHAAVGQWIGPAIGDQIQIANANGDSDVQNSQVMSLVRALPIGCSINDACGFSSTTSYSAPSLASDIDSGLCDWRTITLVDTVATLSFFQNGQNNPTSCTVTEITANATGSGSPVSYVWNTGETTQSITVVSGTYSVTVTFDDGCTATQTITI
jgi:hypothetical protein